VLRAIFFDFGGTLMDPKSDHEAHVLLMEKIKKEFKLPLTVEQLLKKYYEAMEATESISKELYIPALVRAENFFKRLLVEHGIVPTKVEVKWFEKAYMESHFERVRLYPDVVEALESLSSLGIHIGVLSEADEIYLKRQLEELEVLHLFKSVTTSEEVGVGKPHPLLFKAALMKAKCEASEAMHVGDSLEKDVKGAKSVGMKAVWVNRAYDHAKKPTSNNEADYVVYTLVELKEIVPRLML